MIRILPAILFLNLVWSAVSISGLVQAGETSGKVLKVLPHFLDEKGRHTLSPSLYERDAYQAYLRRNPELISTIRFDIQWDAKKARKSELRLQVEIRATDSHRIDPYLLEEKVKRGWWLTDWDGLEIPSEDYRRLGKITAWRATLWEGENLLDEQKSFLW